MSTYGYKYTDVHMHLHMHMYTYIHINTSTTPIVKLLTARLPSLQEHRIRASVLGLGLELLDLRPLDDVFLEDPQADPRFDDIQRAPDMTMTSVFHLCSTSLAVALLGRLDCHSDNLWTMQHVE